MAESSKALNIFKEAALFFFRDGTEALSRVLVGAVLGVLIGSGASALTIGMVGLSMVGLTALSQMGVQISKEQSLVNLYRDEIASTLGKTRDQVTVSDLDPMCKTPDEGGKGSYAIKAAVEDYRSTRNYYIASQAATSALMTGGLALAHAFIATDAAVVLLGGASSLLYNELFNSVQTGGKLLYDVDKEPLVNDVKAISDQIGLGGRISSTRVFGVFVEANPALAEEIRERCGDSYEALNITQKRELVRDYDSEYNLYRITQDINFGHINPTELAFLAYGQQSGVPRREQALVPFSGIEPESTEICAEEHGQVVCRGKNNPTPSHAILIRNAEDISHGDRVLEERANAPSSRAVH